MLLRDTSSITHGSPYEPTIDSFAANFVPIFFLFYLFVHRAQLLFSLNLEV